MPQDWLYNSGFNFLTSVDMFPPNCIGFIYEILNFKTGKYYIGKKSLYSNTKKKLTKKELAEIETKGRKPTFKRVIKESNWKDYWGSNKQLLADIKTDGIENFQRQILKFCYTKKQLTYWEMHYQCERNVLNDEKSYNDNILAKFFTKDLIDPLELPE